MKYRILSLLTAVILISSLSAAAQETPADFVLAGFDGTDTQRQWVANAFFAEMEKQTGIRFDFRQYADQASWTAAKAAMTAGAADLPDVLYKAALTRDEEQRLFDAGVLIDLKPLLSEHCPHLSAILDSHPEILREISLPGGQIVSLPYISFGTVQNAMWINSKWLKQLKLEAPTDLAGLETVLRAFKTRDPNMNGREDEIPLAFLGVFDLHFLSHAFGFLMNDYHIYAQDGKAVFAPLTEEYLTMIRWLRERYAEGLLDRNGFYSSDTLRAVTSKDSAQTYGIFFNTSLTNLLPADWAADYQVLLPLTYDGRQRYRSLWGSTITGTFALTSACKDPARALGWVDRLYTEDGAVLASIGRRNIDYVIDGDGTWRLLNQDSINNTYTAEVLINSGTTPPGISSDEFQRRYSDATIARIVADTLTLNEYCELPFPAVHLSAEQAAYITPLQGRIGLETDLQASRWILGEDALDDAAVSAFRGRLEAEGLDSFMQFWQERLDETEVQP